MLIRRSISRLISFGAFVGTVFGRSPFFYRFYAADLSDLLPSRVQELNLACLKEGKIGISLRADTALPQVEVPSLLNQHLALAFHVA